MKFRIFPPKSIKLIIITIFLLLFISMPAYTALWGNKVDTQDLQRIITELRIYDDPDLPYYNEKFRLYYHDSRELLNALNNKIEINQQAMNILDADIKKEELGNLTYGRYLLNAINEKELVEIGIKTGSPGQANGEYFSKLSENLADWKSQLSKFLLTKIIGATCTAIGAPTLSIGISTLGLFCDLSIIKTNINKLNEVWYEKAFWSYMQFRNDHNYDHISAWESYAETQVKYILNLSLLSLEKQKKAREAIEENFKSLWNNYEDHIVNHELDKNFKSQQRESLKMLLLCALGAEPHPIITSPLKITPDSPYQEGDIINAEFTITNQGAFPIRFSVLTVGGRDPDNQVADFSHRQNIILKPIESYDYKGTLTLNKVGNYHFFCTYQTPDGNWNTSIDLGSGLANEDRTEDISVEKNEVESLPAEMIEVNLYFSDSQAMYLVPEKRKILKTSTLARHIVNELIKGPASPDLYPTIPQGTQINEVYIAGDIVYIDLSEEVFKNHPGGSSGQLMTVYSMVNTLTEIPPIRSVQILVAGNERESLVGHVDISRPLLRDEDWIKP